MKKVILSALNARYFHSNLAIRCLKAIAGNNYDIILSERTINDKIYDIEHEIILQDPAAVGFSCYIWNIEKILKIADDIKKVLPNCFVFLGGPEVSYDVETFLKKHDFIDMIIIGEGEVTFCEWIEKFENNKNFTDVPGTVQKVEGKVVINPPQKTKFDLNKLPFLYKDLEDYKNKILYFETSRGCPYKCSYCISSLLDNITFMDEDKVLFAFDYFLQNNLQQVKLVDRTFNYPTKRSNALFRELVKLSEKYPEAKTNFHFEITGTQVNDEMIDILRSAPEGLIQFEIGIQSTNKDTLNAINRIQDEEKLFGIIKKILELKNIKVYVDLIAGLPHESYNEFANSFNKTYKLNANKIHLGFLKILKGSQLWQKAQEYKIIYENNAPYKVLKTKDISYKELVKLDKIEQTIEIYKNSHHYQKTLEYVVGKYPSPFLFFEFLCDFLDEKKFFVNPQKLTVQFNLINEFILSTCDDKSVEIDTLHDCLLYDWIILEKPRRFPECVNSKYSNKQKQYVRDFYNSNDNIKKYLTSYIGQSPSTISRMCYIAFFRESKDVILFDYNKNKQSRASLISKDNNYKI